MNQQDATSEYVSMAMDAVQIYTFVNLFIFGCESSPISRNVVSLLVS